MHLLHALPPPFRNSGLGCGNIFRLGTTSNKYFYLGKYTDSTDLDKRSAAVPVLPGWQYFRLSLNIVQPKLFHFLLWLGEPGLKPSGIISSKKKMIAWWCWIPRGTSSSTAPISIISSSAPKPDVSVSNTSPTHWHATSVDWWVILNDIWIILTYIDWCTQLSTSKHPNNYSLVFEGLHGQESPPLRRYWNHFVRHLSHLQVALIIPSQNILSRLRQSTPTHCHSKRV